MDRSFRSVGFTDLDGDSVVRHAFLSDEEAEELMGRLAGAGMRDVTVNNLSSPQSRDAGVTSADVKSISK